MSGPDRARFERRHDPYVIGIAAELEDHAATSPGVTIEQARQLAGARVHIATRVDRLLLDLDPDTISGLRAFYLGSPSSRIAAITVEARRREIARAHPEHGLVLGVAYEAALDDELDRAHAATEILCEIHDEEHRADVFHWLTGRSLHVTVPGWKRADRLGEVIGESAGHLSFSALEREPA